MTSDHVLVETQIEDVIRVQVREMQNVIYYLTKEKAAFIKRENKEIHFVNHEDV